MSQSKILKTAAASIARGHATADEAASNSQTSARRTRAGHDAFTPSTGGANQKPDAGPCTTTHNADRAPGRARFSAGRLGSSRASEKTHPAGSQSAPRPGTKQDAVIALLRRSEGVTIAAVMAATGWQAHSVRGFFAAVARKKLGLDLVSEKTGAERVYRIPGDPKGKTRQTSAKASRPAITAKKAALPKATVTRKIGAAASPVA